MELLKTGVMVPPEMRESQEKQAERAAPDTRARLGSATRPPAMGRLWPGRPAVPRTIRPTHPHPSLTPPQPGDSPSPP